MNDVKAYFAFWRAGAIIRPIKQRYKVAPSDDDAADRELDHESDRLEARLNTIKALALDQLMVGLARIEIAVEASGAAALYRESEDLEEKATELHEQICSTPATSFDALLWQLEAAAAVCGTAPLAAEELLDTIIDGVKGLAGPACSLGLDRLLKAERTPSEPGDGDDVG